MKRTQILSEILTEEKLLDRIKVENFLLVTLKLRPCSRMNLPAELPNGDSIGKKIDEKVFPKLRQLQGETDPQKRLAAIASLKRDMRRAFETIVLSSEHYKAHLNWAKKLGLHSRLVAVRPTLSEFYLYNDRKIGNRLKRLMREREKLRAKAYRNATPTMDRVRFAYPEEFEGSWLKEMGRVLGYPDCCVDAYASDRKKGVNVEQRASQQIETMERHAEIDPLTYFISYFFPCTPNCNEALSRGREIHERLRRDSSELGNLYSSIAEENMRTVRHQPEIIAEYRKRANSHH
ncbi:hypothetical protein DRO66_09180 [Candidatus Bathyarchaeota archaeon]|nr:MAG: hypothetical protein DRO66_09180 [Candidatus Bathyarchaeota archaeon]